MYDVVEHFFFFAVGSYCTGRRAHAHAETEAYRAEIVFTESGC